MLAAIRGNVLHCGQSWPSLEGAEEEKATMNSMGIPGVRRASGCCCGRVKKWLLGSILMANILA